MSTTLEEAKRRLQYPFESLSEEWEYIEAVIQKFKSERLAFVTWIFEESMAYWDTRVRAGMILLGEDESEAWRIIKKLVMSSKADDNGTVLTLFENIDNSRGLELAREWLQEQVHPMIQLAAIEFLKDAYSEQAWSRLQALCDHEDPQIRKSAKRLVDELKAS